MLSLDQLKKGQKAIVKSFRDEVLGARLIEMGCLPGEEVRLLRIAPLGCPLVINVAGYELSLRKKEAAAVEIEMVA